MAQVSNYGTLKSWLSTTAHRGDLTADIPGFIQSAESMIAEHVRAIEMITYATLDETDRSSGPTYNAPTDFLGARAITGTKSGTPYALAQVSITELYRYTLSGDPQVYAVYDKQIEFRASPAQNTDFLLLYYAQPAAFVGDSDTNALLTKHPTLYQHAGLHWLHIHTQDVELATAHGDAFIEVADQVNALAEETRGAASVADQYNYHSEGIM